MSDQETALRAAIAKLHAELDALTCMPQADGKRRELRHQIAELTQQIHALHRDEARREKGNGGRRI
jgi:hypothetical protein